MLHVRNVLFARDFSSLSEQALPYALDLAGRLGARLHLLYAEVLHGAPFLDTAGEEGEAATLRERLERISEAQRPDGFDRERVDIQTAVERGVAAAPAILDYAEAHDVDLIVIATHGRRGVRKLLLGSVAEEVVRLAACPVLTIRGPGEATPAARVRTILVPVDFSEHSRAALRHAGALAALYDARLDLLHVVDPQVHPIFHQARVFSIYDMHPDIDEQAHVMLERFHKETDGAAGRAVDVAVRSGSAPREIATAAEERGADLIVMATHGLTGVEHFLLGSVTEKVVRRAPCPVFVVKSFGKKLLDAPAAGTASSVTPGG